MDFRIARQETQGDKELFTIVEEWDSAGVDGSRRGMGIDLGYGL